MHAPPACETSLSGMRPPEAPDGRLGLVDTTGERVLGTGG